ncbi:hypothetical protein Pryu01_00114 [Paraliobacillus ryukyuensis]|uniref:Flagellar hook-length control protein FliK n=1 Tax=Paraliobacillus ryukyuensis TaxID=200904 RepID=A0A366EHH2_9BACI|nr:hypothetical protein [Paraliobacillus ryukyuensis]RBP01814.1 hypothetical protein DES48_101558 [Paraliobacillus ryukyuensis]
MSIYSNHVTSKSSVTTANVTSKTSALKPGQILLGKVLEIYPNQRASIQLGNQKVIAQLKTALSLDSNYWFQVQSNDQMLHLKVVTDQPGTKSMEQQVVALLKQLKLPLSKANIQFVRNLMEANVTFRPETLIQALQLKPGQGKTSAPLLMEMMERQLPITSSIYQSLANAEKNSLRTQMQEVYELLQPSKQGTNSTTPLLASRLNSLLFNQSTKTGASNQMLPFLQDQLDQGNQDVVQVLKKAGMVAESLKMTQTDAMKSQLEVAVKQSGDSYISQRLGQLFSRQLGLTEQQQVQFAKLMQAVGQPGQDHPKQQALQQQLLSFIENNHLTSKIRSFLTNEEATLFQKWQQEPTWKTFASFLPKLTSLAEQQLPKNAEHKLLDLLAMNKNITMPIKEQFVLQLKHFLQFSGINLEHQITEKSQAAVMQDQSLKKLLLQSLQGSTIGKQEKENLLQTLIGMQIGSIKEDGAFIQATMQLPNMFGLEKNMQIDMESKRNEKGEINPDYCRIMFFLELSSIGDTWIDMSIQNRRISLTVFNQHQEISPFIEQLQPSLQEGLAKSEYQLLSVQFKQLTEQIQEEIKKTQEQPISPTKGVDIRI